MQMNFLPSSLFDWAQVFDHWQTSVLECSWKNQQRQLRYKSKTSQVLLCWQSILSRNTRKDRKTFYMCNTAKLGIHALIIHVKQIRRLCTASLFYTFANRLINSNAKSNQAFRRAKSLGTSAPWARYLCTIFFYIHIFGTLGLGKPSPSHCNHQVTNISFTIIDHFGDEESECVIRVAEGLVP